MDSLQYGVRFLLVLLAFIYWLFPIYLSIWPNAVNSIIYHAIPALYLLFYWKTIKRLFLQMCGKRYFIVSAVLFVFALFWALCALLYNNTSDYSYFMKLFTVVRAIYIDLFLLLLAIQAVHSGTLLERFSCFWCSAVSACVLFTIICLMYPAVRFFWESILISTVESDGLLSEAMYITRFGFGGFAGFGQTIVASIGAILSYYLLERGRSIGLFFLFFSLLGNLFYGRIGILISAVALLFLFIRTLSLRKALKHIFWGSLVLGVISSIFLLSDDPLLEAWRIWLMQPIEGFLTGLSMGQLSFGSSGDKLVYGMYFWPDDTTFLLGDGRYTNSDESYYMHTDAGLMRIVLYFGVIGAGFVYASYLFLILGIMQNIKKERIVLYTCQILIAIFFLTEYKGDAYPLFFGIAVVFLLSSREISQGGSL
ncbi:hypothetical protein [Selenomonas sputigena]|uniref:hypothetical protein n=1 Tax=Selenomonas sputigena TaxID=69823 RepID=UPI0022320D4A|nr:hypothetical protein [Selenomonas sputigena]UZD42487.1 hypothetical protein OL240_08020 [Selenomonas sputigena]